MKNKKDLLLYVWPWPNTTDNLLMWTIFIGWDGVLATILYKLHFVIMHSNIILFLIISIVFLDSAYRIYASEQKKGRRLHFQLNELKNLSDKYSKLLSDRMKSELGMSTMGTDPISLAAGSIRIVENKEKLKEESNPLRAALNEDSLGLANELDKLEPPTDPLF